MTKNRPPSRLLSWIAQWTRRSSNTNVDDEYTATPTPTTPTTASGLHTTATCDATPNFVTSEPINVPKQGRPSITLSVAGTIDESINSSSSIHSSSYASSTVHRPSAMSDPFKGNEGPLMTRLGQSFPEKRPSLALPQQTHRPPSVFSLPPPNTRANRDEPRPRISIDTFESIRPSAIAATAIPRLVKYKSDDWPRADRMIIRQELIRLALDGLYASPVRLSDPSKDIKVLHIGCGNGAWCMAMAKKYKNAWVLGIDERNVLDRRKGMPTNFRFMCAQEDILAGLRRLPDDQFDFIYGRFLIFSFPPDLYRDIVKECWRLCKPSGYVEMMELDMQIYGNPQVGPMTQMLNSQVICLMKRRSLDPHFAQHLQDIFFFHQLVEQMHQQHGDAYHASHTSLPLGVWGGRIGVMFRDDLHDLIEMIHIREQKSHRTVLLGGEEVDDDDDDDDDDDEYKDTYNPWTDQRLAATLERVDEEFETRWAFMNLHHVYAQKL